MFAERTPAALRNAVVHHFGAQGRSVLLLGMYVTFAVVAIVIGMLARRDAAAGVAGVAAFTLFAAFVAITRPAGHVADVMPVVIGGLAGVAAALWLFRASAPQQVTAQGRSRAATAPARSTGGDPEEDTMTGTVDRRRFLRAAGVTAVGAAAAGVGGETAARQAVPLAKAPPAAMAPAPRTPARRRRPQLKIDPMTPLPADETLDSIAGLSPFYTPVKEFYRIDTSLILPKVSPADWQLRIHGMVDRPMTLTYDDLIRLPMIDRDITLTCVSESVGGNYVGNARWQGTLLAPILRKAGVHRGADQIVMRDVKGMTIGVATDPVLDGRDSMLAVAMNGQVLPQAHGYPVRVVVPGLYGYVSATKWVVDMELTTFGAFSAYWVKQRPAWSQQAPIKTESRIDVPKRLSTCAAGQVTIAGVAWAQHTGIEAVEVGIDGVFHEARLPAQDTIDTWRQWHYIWDATPGAARAPGAGHRQERLHADRDQAQGPAGRRDRLPHNPRERGLEASRWRAPALRAIGLFQANGPGEQTAGRPASPGCAR